MAGTGRKVWAADEILAAADLQSYIQDQVVFVYANSTARASGILSPTEGMISYLQDTNLLYYYSGSAWEQVTPTSLNASVITAGTLTVPVDTTTVTASGNVTGGSLLAGTAISLNGSTGQIYTSGVVTAGGTATVGAVKTSGIVDAGQLYSQGRIDALGAADISGAVQLLSTLSVSSTSNLAGQIRSAGSRATLTGSYNVLYINTDGYLGIPASSERFKQDVVSAVINPASVYDLNLVNFRYRADVESLGDDAEVQLGFIAEDVEKHLGPDFVFYDEDGQVAGIHYEKLALIAIPVLKAQAQKIDDLEARIVRLEK